MGEEKRRFSSGIWQVAAALLVAIAIAAVTILGLKTRIGDTPAGKPNDSNGLSATGAIAPRIVSLLPSATDILIGMGCRNHLAAVSNADADPQVIGLPRVGDYERTDWEQIAQLHPQVIVTHYSPTRVPAGFIQHLNQIGAQQLNLQTETLDGPDKAATIYDAIDALGKACNEPAKAAQASANLRGRIKAVRRRVAGKGPVAALIVIGPEGSMVAGRDTFLSELLAIAGGQNAAGSLAARYPSIDREQILAFRPQVVLQLLPNASPQVQEQARRFWRQFPDLPALNDGRVIQLTDWYVMLAGCHAADTAERFADALHPTDRGVRAPAQIKLSTAGAAKACPTSKYPGFP